MPEFIIEGAWYENMNGTVEGEIDLKRQFRIRKGKIEYILESDLTLQNDVLQKELSQASSGKMKNIIATIQREQNAIICNENARNLIIQGIAGSDILWILFELYKTLPECSFVHICKC